MAVLFAVDFALNVGLNVPVLATAFAPRAEHPVVRIGVGTSALDATEDARTGGPLPHMSLYDSHGVLFAHELGGQYSEPGGDTRVEIGASMFGSGTDYTQTPHYMRLVADGPDATCITYVTVTAANGDYRTWNAGYAQQCGAPWYPSPEIFPSTDNVPGCIWLSKDDRFLQGISFKLTDFAFITSDEADAMRGQYSEHKDTLCEAPGRMAFWKEAWVDDCIPYYPFTEEKDPDTLWDTDFQKVRIGHTVPCELRGKLWNQDLDLGKGSFGGEIGSIGSGEAGTNTDSPPDGDGSFGGQIGSIPISSAGDISSTTQAAATQTSETFDVATLPKLTHKSSQTQAPQSKSTESSQSIEPIQSLEPTQSIEPTQSAKEGGGIGNAGDQGGRIVSYNAGGPGATWSSVKPRATAPDGSSSGSITKRQQQQQQQQQQPRQARRDTTVERALTVLARRDALRQKRDHCVDRLVVSHLPQHSAREVCGSATSWGPDFVSVAEGVYCDMCERQLWNLCKEGDSTESYCFDLQKREVRLPEVVNREALGELPDMRKVFDIVKEWH